VKTKYKIKTKALQSISAGEKKVASTRYCSNMVPVTQGLYTLDGN